MPELPEICAGPPKGSVNIHLAIQSAQALPDGSHLLEAYGVRDSEKVGLGVILGANWKAGKLGPIAAFTGVVKYHSLGAATDSFIRNLDEIYKTNLRPKVARSDTLFAAISLRGDPTQLARGRTELKLFFESDEENGSAEFYTNIELAKGLLEIREKDSAYRAAIVKALSLT